MALLQKKVLISLHGIRTRGEWQKELCPLVSEKGWKYYPLDYGNFTAPQLAMGWTHSQKMKWFRERMNRIYAENPDALPSIIAHSFGSLILAKSLRRFSDLKFDKVILTGSIVPIDYPWKLIADREQISFVRNIVGKNDFWSKIAAYLPWSGAGNSGAQSFNKPEWSEFLEDITYDEFDHSDAHFPDVFKARVVPFLEDDKVRSNASSSNYLTYVDPFKAACWTVVSYNRQYVRRFFQARTNSDFYCRETQERLPSVPKGLIVVIPNHPSGASIQARDEFEKEFDLHKIAFSSKARGALICKEGFVYDIPSALESFSVYDEVLYDSSASIKALGYVAEIMRDAFSSSYPGIQNPPKVMTLDELHELKGNNDV